MHWENAFFVVWRARFIALFISILKFIRDFYRCIDFSSSRGFSESFGELQIVLSTQTFFYSFPKCTRAQFIAAIKSA